MGWAIRRSTPVRTFADWVDPPRGFFEIDMGEHCGGPKTDGDYVHTFTLTNIATGWTECVAMRVREQMLVIERMVGPQGTVASPGLRRPSDRPSRLLGVPAFAQAAAPAG